MTLPLVESQAHSCENTTAACAGGRRLWAAPCVLPLAGGGDGGLKLEKEGVGVGGQGAGQKEEHLGRGTECAGSLRTRKSVWEGRRGGKTRRAGPAQAGLRGPGQGLGSI